MEVYIIWDYSRASYINTIMVRQLLKYYIGYTYAGMHGAGLFTLQAMTLLNHAGVCMSYTATWDHLLCRHCAGLSNECYRLLYRVHRHGVDLSKRTVASLLSNSDGGPRSLW